MDFISWVFTIILGLYLFGFIARRFLLPWLLKYIMYRVQQKFTQGFGPYNTQQAPPSQPQPSQSKTKKQTTSADHIGEFVDYEEIK